MDKILSKIKIGTLITSVDECKMYATGNCALTIGKKYKVLAIEYDVDGKNLVIRSDDMDRHLFPLKDFYEFFKFPEIETKEQRTHLLAMDIVKLLIDSELSISDQLKVINNVREKLIFCKQTGQEMKQQKLNF
jgi:hypothetical protein